MRNEIHFSFLVHSTHIYLPMKMEQSVPKCRHINSRRRVITQKKAYTIQNPAKALNQENYFVKREEQKSEILLWEVLPVFKNRSQPLQGAWGNVVVKTLRYYSDGPGINSRWCHWIFQWHIPSYRTIAVESTQPLVKMSTRNISWG